MDFFRYHLIKKAKLILRNKLFILILISAGFLVYSFFIEPHWIQTNHIQINTKLNKSYKFVQISDVHMRLMTFKENLILNKVAAESPDAIFVTGDLVLPVPDLNQVIDFLKKLSNIAPVYTVSGNWEHWVIKPAEEIQIYKKSNVTFLMNNSAVINKEICIIGLDDYLSGKPDFYKAVVGCDSSNFKLALFHSPGWIDTTDNKIFDLGLAGHTHGGQIRLPFYTPVTPPGSGKYISGFYEKNSNKIYVSRGLGQSVIQARLLARPEIVVIDLVKAK